jgi:hypothetical protein
VDEALAAVDRPRLGARDHHHHEQPAAHVTTTRRAP